MRITMRKTAEQVRAARAAAYPSVGDQLDAIGKLAAALADTGLALPPETISWIDSLRAVKAANPK